jgi:hypothetical protein
MQVFFAAPYLLQEGDGDIVFSDSKGRPASPI